MSWKGILKTEWKRTRPYDRHIDGPFDMEKPAGKRFEFMIRPDKDAKEYRRGIARSNEGAKFYTFSTPVDIIDENAAKEIALEEAEKYFETDNLNASLKEVVVYRFSNRELQYFLFRDENQRSSNVEMYVPRPEGVTPGKSFAVIDWYNRHSKDYRF